MNFLRSQSLSLLRQGGVTAGRIHIARPWLKKKTSLPSAPAYSLNDINACHEEDEGEEPERGVGRLASLGAGIAAAVSSPRLPNLGSSLLSESSEEEEAARGALAAHERRRVALRRLQQQQQQQQQQQDDKFLLLPSKQGSSNGGLRVQQRAERSDGVTDDDEDVVY